ncbi:MAG: hypothetical protein ACP6IQ_09080 [Candidatus Njordarchaeia archaeon]
MEKRIILGVAFFSIIAISVVVGFIFQPRYKQETLTTVRSGDEHIVKVDVELGNGFLVIVKNDTGKYWRVTAKYGETSKEPDIEVKDSDAGKTLEVDLGNGILYIEIQDLSELVFDVDNGHTTLIFMNMTLNISGTVSNGNFKLVAFGGNYSLDVNIANGNADLRATDTRNLTGEIDVTNGEIDLTLLTDSGGKIEYSVTNGLAYVFEGSFQKDENETDTGVNGTLTRSGNEIDFNMSLMNGEIVIVVVEG